MWTPYDWEISAVKRDIDKCESVKSSLESTRGSVESLRGNVSVLQAHLNQCFGADASASSFTDSIQNWFGSAIASVNSTIASLEERLSSLKGSQSSYIREAEEAARRREEWLRNNYPTYWNFYR